MARCLIRRFPTLRTHPESRFYWTCKATILSCLAGVADVPSRAAVQCNVGASGAMSSSVEANAPRDSVENTSSKDSIPKIIVLTGATGVGKTELSLILADRLNGEIISADSVQASDQPLPAHHNHRRPVMYLSTVLPAELHDVSQRPVMSCLR